jgi:hypothetical protein
MKNIFFTLTILLINLVSIGQNCIPDTSYKSPGYYPDSLLPAYIGQSYEQVITTVVPVDTTIELLPGFPVTLPIDSIVVTSISNLPPGFSFSCFPPSCGFPGGTANCIKITGNPLTGAGEYNIIANVDAYSAQAGAVSPLAETINFGKFLVIDNVGLSKENNLNFQLSKVFPQPFSGMGTFEIETPISGNLNIAIIDILGKEISSKNYFVSKGSSNVSVNQNLNNGIYIVLGKIENYSFATKLVVTK